MPKKKPISVTVSLEAELQDLDRKKNIVATADVTVTREFTGYELAAHLTSGFEFSDLEEEKRFLKEFVGCLFEAYADDVVKDVVRELADQAGLTLEEKSE